VFLVPNITSPGNGGPYNYAWTPAAGNTSSLTVTGNAPVAAVTNTYGLTVSDGCTIPNAQTVFTLVVNPLPTVNFLASATEACAPATINFTATPGSPGGYSYEWINDEKDVMGTTNPVSYQYTQGDTITVSVTITNTLTGCSNTETKNDYIVIHKAPIASFYAVPSSASILDPNFDFVNTCLC
jgi:PKD repeat protein